jgi:hypothetical protein
VIHGGPGKIPQIPNFRAGKTGVCAENSRGEHSAGAAHGGQHRMGHRQGALAQTAQILHGRNTFHWCINSFSDMIRQPAKKNNENFEKSP